MFTAVPMVRVRIQVPGRAAAAATHAIAQLGLLHLIDITHGRADAALPGCHERLALHRALRQRLRDVLDRLGLPQPVRAPASGAPIEDYDLERQRIAAALEPIEAAATAAWQARDAALGEASGLERTLVRAQGLQGSGVDGTALADLRFAAACLVSAGEASLASLSEFLAPAPHVIETIDAPPGAEALAVVIAPSSARTRLDAALRLVHVEAIEPSTLAGPARVAAVEIALARARTMAAAAARTLGTLAEAHGAALREMLAREETCVLLLQAQERFGAAGRFIVISGWVPAQAADRLRTAVATASPSAIVDIETPVGIAAMGTGASVPILHRNPLLLRPFQALVDLYDTPSYREVQPTAFFAVSFLLMFGVMFGDVGHGAVLAAAGYYLFRYIPRYLDYGILLMEAGTASAAFGFLYGSFFGIPGALPVLWLEPTTDLPAFMRIAIGLGVVLVSAGLILNVVNSWRLGQRASALFGVRGLFGAFLYWTALALLVRTMMPAAFVVPAWLLGALAAAAATLVALRAPLVRRLERTARTRPPGPAPPPWLAALEGSVELVDTLFSYFANTVSFIRVAAFAAVHAGVFVAMFAVSDTLAKTRYGGVLALAALAVGNVVLILLEGLTVSVQVLRLEYYEFFGKFFRGGGEMYRPLRLDAPQNKEGTS